MADDPKKKALETASIVEDALRSIAGQVRDIFDQALSNTDRVAQSVAKDIQLRFNQMAKVTDDIASNANKLQEGLLKTKDVEDQILRRKTKQDALATQLLTYLKQQGKEAGSIEELIQKQNNGSIKLTRSQQRLVKEYVQSKEYNKEYINQLKEQGKEAEKIKKTTGVTGSLLRGITKIPIVGQFLNADEALKAANKAAATGANKIGAMGAALGSMGKSLMTSLSDPLAVIGLIVAAFKALIELGFRADKQVVELQKSLYLSKGAAEGLREVFQTYERNNKILVKGFNDNFEILQYQIDAVKELSNVMGGVSLATRDEVQSHIMLTKQMGLSVEESQALYVLGRQNKMNAAEVVFEIQKQVKANQKQTGVLLDAKKITQDVAKINGQLRLQYGNNVNQLTAAVIQANKLGFSLEQTKKIAEGLLNFEQSIEDELSAELLIGRDLNLEQARLLALNGKSAEAVALIAEQMGGSAEFSKLNVIQQEQLAKAAGMSADELANSMIHQENLNKLGTEERARLEKQLDYLRSIGAEEQAQNLERAVAQQGDLEAAMARSTAEANLAATIEKIKDLLSDIVDGPAMKLANGLAEMVAHGTGLYQVLGGVMLLLGRMSVAKLITGLIQAGIAAAGLGAMSAGVASALTFGVAALAIVAGIASIMSGINSASDQATARAEKAKNGTNFANGGVVRSRIDNATIGERGPEAIIPLSSPSAKQMMNGGGPIQVTVNAVLDGKVLATAVAEVDRTESNKVATERQLNNREIQ